MKPWLRAAGFVVLFLAVAAVCAAGVHQSCTSAPPPITGLPVAGTPRAEFCGAVDRGWSRWAGAFFLVALGIACGLAWPKRTALVAVLAALIVSVLFGILIASSLLEASITI